MHDQRATPNNDASLLLAPFDRALFYPAAHALFRLIRPLPITPNQVTVIHLALGLSTFWWMARPSGGEPLLTVAIFFLRNTLDCLDGVIARAKNLTSPMGRVLDEWSDAMSCAALIAGVSVAAWRQAPSPWIPLLSVLSMTMIGFLALQSELGRRRFAYALTTGRDRVWMDYEDAKNRRFEGIGGWLGYLADWAKLHLNGASRNPERLSAEARFIHEQAGSADQRSMLRIVGLAAGENPMLVLLAFVAAGQNAAGLAAASAYALVLLIAYVWSTTRYLSRVRGD